jgi:hypothetical protein
VAVTTYFAICVSPIFLAVLLCVNYDVEFGG